ncbi:MAG: glutathione S-transferase family protein [Gammaproteobacteria bacterium]|nr:glutathione S-transferase family protein [Gammaproteobacteria bacterium]
MIKLYAFGPAFGLIDPSPFVIKVDFYLRAAGLEFLRVPGFQNMRGAPKGKLPYIIDNGAVVADSAFIVSYLKAEYGDPLDGGLPAEQKAVVHAFTKMMDENTYWCLVHDRWINNACWPAVRKEFFGGLPWPLRVLVPMAAQRRVKKSLYIHGLGRHSDDEILDIAKRDLKALSDYLGDKEWFFGKGPTTLDVFAFAFVGGLVIPPFHSRMAEAARSFPNLVRFVERVKAKYYPA